MSQLLTKHFENIFEILRKEKLILFPTSKQKSNWEKILNKWTSDSQLPLLARKSSSLRGKEIENNFGRMIIRTDNSPAHWVFRKYVLDDEVPDLKIVRKEWEGKTFPIALMIKVSEKPYLINTQVISKKVRIGNDDLKLAHIKPIALSRKADLQLNIYEDHHNSFLSLRNMYAIDKKYSGLAEVEEFNKIIERSLQLNS